MNNSIKPVGDADFKSKVIDSGKPVLVSFWAQWSTPSRTIFPSLEAIAAECGGVEIFSFDTDANTSVPTEHSVMSLPTLLMFKKGEVVDKIVGARPKGDIKSMVARAVSGGQA